MNDVQHVRALLGGRDGLGSTAAVAVGHRRVEDIVHHLDHVPIAQQADVLGALDDAHDPCVHVEGGVLPDGAVFEGDGLERRGGHGKGLGCSSSRARQPGDGRLHRCDEELVQAAAVLTGQRRVDVVADRVTEQLGDGASVLCDPRIRGIDGGHLGRCGGIDQVDGHLLVDDDGAYAGRAAAGERQGDKDRSRGP